MATEGIETVCENCKARTRLGAYYSFVQGSKTSPGTREAFIYASHAVDPTAYKFAESAGVYLCNKCVSLKDRRASRLVFRNGTLAFLALLAISIPVSLLMNNLFFITPLMLVIFGGPLAWFFFRTLKAKEQAPLRAYADLYNNPEHYYPKHGSSDPLAEQLVVNKGEKLAIALKRPSLAGSGVDALLTHQEAKTLTRLNPGKIDLSKQKKDGIRNIVIGGVIGLVSIALGFAGLNGVIVYLLVGVVALSFLASGIGILTTGDPGPMPNQEVHWSCPYCHHEVGADDLPTPGLHAVCPHCGKVFGRKSWWG